MVLQIHCEANIAMHPAEYWVIRNTSDFFNIECSVLKNSSKYICEEKTAPNGTILAQYIVTEPDLSLVPQWIKNMGPPGGVVFTDYIECLYDNPETPYYLSIHTKPSIFQEKCNIRGVLKVFPSPDGNSCTQVLDMSVSVDVFAAGTIIEQIISNGLHNAYNLLPSIVEDWKAQSWKISTNFIFPTKGDEDWSNEWDMEESSTDDDGGDTFYDANGDDNMKPMKPLLNETNHSRTSSSTLSNSSMGIGSMDYVRMQDRHTPMIVTDQPPITMEEQTEELNDRLPPASTAEGSIMCGIPSLRFLW